jgi:hypothetical protein
LTPNHFSNDANYFDLNLKSRTLHFRGIVCFRSCSNPRDFIHCKERLIRLRNVDVVYKLNFSLIPKQCSTVLVYRNLDCCGKCCQIIVVLVILYICWYILYFIFNAFVKGLPDGSPWTLDSFTNAFLSKLESYPS